MKENIRISIGVIKEQIIYFKRDIIILSILTIIAAIGNGAIPLIAGKFFDSLISSTYLSKYGILLTPLNLLATWFVIQIIILLIDKKISYAKDMMGFSSRVNYIQNIHDRLINHSMAFHKKTKFGEITSNVNEAGWGVQSIFGDLMIGIVPQILTIVVAFFVIYSLNIPLAIIITVAMFVYTYLFYKSSGPLHKLQSKIYESWEESFGYAWDTITNIQAVKHAVTEEYELKNINNRFTNYILNPYSIIFKIQTSLDSYQRSIIICSQLAIFFSSIYFVHNGTITIGELFAFNAYTALVFGPFSQLNQQLKDIRNSIIKISATEKMLGNEYEIYNPIDEVVMKEIKGEIEFKNVSFHYNEGSPVLRDISFKVEPGQTVALVGESGVGKSTLIELLAGYYFANNGEVLIDDVNIKRIGLKSLRKQIATVPQEVVLFNDTIKHNIQYGNFDASDEQVEDAAKKAHAYDFIMKFQDKWQQIVGERGVKLSVGQKQRVAIARAILRNPKILILDEPTSALDAGSESVITESFEELMKGRTTFIIAHRLSTVRKADKILVFKDGNIIESGTHSELLKIKGGEYKRLYELQVGLHE